MPAAARPASSAIEPGAAMTRAIYLGGGRADTARDALAAFFARTPRDADVLLLAHARRGAPDHQAGIATSLKALARFGRRIHPCPDLAAVPTSRLDAAGGVLIGDGNTFSLREDLQDSGWDEALARYAEAGGPIYGHAAGAIVLGRSIENATYLDRNGSALADLSGLDLLGGLSVWCGFEPEHESAARSLAFAEDHAMILMQRDAGAAFDGRRILRMGRGEVVLLLPDGDAHALPFLH